MKKENDVKTQILGKTREELFGFKGKFQIGLATEESNTYTTQTMHWHQEFEFVVCLKGTFEVDFGNEKHVIKEGDGVFVNSCALHQPHPKNCRYILALINPMMLCTDADTYASFVTPLLDTEDFPGLVLHASDPKQKKIIDKIIEMNQYVEDDRQALPLFVQSSIFEIWQYFYENAPIKGKFTFESDQITCIKSMMQYVHNNYSKNIKISDIAKYHSISEGTCNNLFNKYVHLSPINYVIEYRLQKAKELLDTSDLNMTEISNRCGFHSSSYFTEMFKKQYNMTPREYRKSR